MLVLSRTIGEQIAIGKDVLITVVGIEGGKIRIGINAPREIPIARLELLPHNWKIGDPVIVEGH